MTEQKKTTQITWWLLRLCSFISHSNIWMLFDIFFLFAQVAVLQEEQNSLLAENDVLTDRANQLDTFEDPSTPSGRKHSQLQQQLETLQEENFRFNHFLLKPTVLYLELRLVIILWSCCQGWRQLRTTIESTVKSWNSSWLRFSTVTMS